MNSKTTAALLLTLLAGTTQTSALDLACLNGQNGFVINATDAGGRAGWSATTAGDINGDGFADLLIDASFASPNGKMYAGACYIIFGGSTVGSNGTLNLEEINGTNGFALEGMNPADYCGRSVSPAGDVNGDGYDDIIVGAHGVELGNGACYVIFGAADVGTTGQIPLQSLDGTNGFSVNKIPTSNGIGFPVSPAGDVNNDGLDDILISASTSSPNGMSSAGESYIIFGNNALGASGEFELASLNGSNGYIINGISPLDQSGLAISALGDFNNDGSDDLILGAPFADPNVRFSAGESYIVYGGPNVGTTGVINLSLLNGTNGFVLNGINDHDQSGKAVSAAGDINGDGIDDAIIGAYAADPNGRSAAGESYVVFGGQNTGATGVLELSSSCSTAPTASPSTASTAGIQAAATSPPPATSTVTPSTTSLSAQAVLTQTATTKPARAMSSSENKELDQAGRSSCHHSTLTTGSCLKASTRTITAVPPSPSAGDINGDGIADIIIGAIGADPNGNTEAGQTYVIFGSTTGFTSPEDLNASGCVTADDLTLLIAAWNTPDADVNNDGTTNATDLALLLAAWTN